MVGKHCLSKYKIKYWILSNFFLILIGLTEFDDAVKYFRKVLEINPSNKDATTHIALSQQQLKAEKSKEKNLYAKMLSSMGK